MIFFQVSESPFQGDYLGFSIVGGAWCFRKRRRAKLMNNESAKAKTERGSGNLGKRIEVTGRMGDMWKMNITPGFFFNIVILHGFWSNLSEMAVYQIDRHHLYIYICSELLKLKISFLYSFHGLVFSGAESGIISCPKKNKELEKGGKFLAVMADCWIVYDWLTWWIMVQKYLGKNRLFLCAEKLCSKLLNKPKFFGQLLGVLEARPQHDIAQNLKPQLIWIHDMIAT